MSVQGNVDDEARHESSVRTLYQDAEVAENYIQNRFTWSWGRLLHDRQVDVLNDAIARHGARTALELAPGPARLTTQVAGLERGVAVEASAEMLEVARARLAEAGVGDVWDLREGNAFDLSSVEETFGLIYTFRFIRHFEVEDRMRLYGEIRERLGPSGVLVFDVVGRAVRDRLDARSEPAEEAGDGGEPAEAGIEKLPVYDVRYTEVEFRAEMAEAGFDVLAMHPVVRHFDLQAWISYKGDTRFRPLSNLIVRSLELLPGSAPLEWVAVTRKRG